MSQESDGSTHPRHGDNGHESGSQRRTDVLGYLRVSTEEQGRSGLGLDDQRQAISKTADYKAWRVVEWIEDTASGKSLDRPGIQRALFLIEDSGPNVLVAAKLDRLARSALDFLMLVERANKNGWAIALLEPDVDMTTPMGKAFATVMAAMAELERNLISERTKAALRAKKARGEPVGGTTVPAPVRRRIVDLRDRGASLRTIAQELNRDGVPTARGGAKWHHSTVASVLRSEGHGGEQ